MVSRRILLAGISGLACCGINPSAFANDFPERTLTFVVPFPPGGGIDVTLRAMAPQLQQRLGKPVVIENRVGAGGNIAATSVARSTGDGHILYAAPTTLATNPSVYRAMPFDTLKDLKPVSLLMRTPYFLVVNADLPAKTIPQLIALLQQNPDGLSYAHSGVGGGLHLAAEMFQALSTTRMKGVSYRGAPPALNDVVAGHVPLMFVDTGTALGQISAGKVRALGVSSTERIPAAPDIPTIAEAGLPGFDAVGWALLCAPSSVAPTIIDRWAMELNAVASSPDIRALIVKLGNLPVESPSPAALQAFLADEVRRWGGLIERVGLAKSL